jgi:hypothetical protein
LYGRNNYICFINLFTSATTSLGFICYLKQNLKYSYNSGKSYKSYSDTTLTSLPQLLRVQGKVKLSRYTPWRRLGERRYSSYSFMTSALDEGEWSASRTGGALLPGKGPPGTHWTGGWVGPKAGLDTEDRGKIYSKIYKVIFIDYRTVVLNDTTITNDEFGRNCKRPLPV